MNEDRCLLTLDELTLENEILKKENLELKVIINELSKENQGYREALERNKVAIARFEASLTD